ncbi:hypothetical protein V6C03_06490 [Methyloligella sp. 2.7D]|uniref:hypothetical protein n=1 Tax=unclassified Methyloligella TaxID=2625955 RepID=UPI00157C1978|nr:hypothetical protein [Methyloligella sp. GL2]QKP78450.1 hypothetical protein HT051_13960 [Methyloligella sp. GL2]
MALLNIQYRGNIRCTVNETGTGTSVTFKDALARSFTPAQAGAEAAGGPIPYRFDDGPNFEVGLMPLTGDPVTGGTRVVESSSNSNAPINLTSAAIFSSVLRADDWNEMRKCIMAPGDLIVSYDESQYVDDPRPLVLLDGSTITDGAADFPIVAARYPDMVSGDDLVLADPRGMFPRIWDGGAGVDPDAVTRTASIAGGTAGDHPMTDQGDAIRNIAGSVSGVGTTRLGGASGAFDTSGATSNGASGGGNSGYTNFDFDASRVVPTADENRPHNHTISLWMLLG